MQHSINKLCADGLRTSLNAKHGIKLKPGHAHDISAAVFGYKSSISLHADEIYPLSNLGQADFLLLEDRRQLVDERLKCLDGLPVDLPPSNILVEYVYSVIRGSADLSEKVYRGFRELATFLANGAVNEKLKMFGVNQAEFKFERHIEVREALRGASITASLDSQTDAGKRSRYCKVDIELQRVAGNLGYKISKTCPTFYSGQFRDPDFNPAFEEVLLPHSYLVRHDPMPYDQC